MAEGRSNHAIASQLHMSAKTVETHIGSMLAKLGLPPAPEDHRRVLAVLTYGRGRISAAVLVGPCRPSVLAPRVCVVDMWHGSASAPETGRDAAAPAPEQAMGEGRVHRLARAGALARTGP